MSSVVALLNDLYNVRLHIGVTKFNLLETPLGKELDALEKQEASLESVIKVKGKFCRGKVIGLGLQLVKSNRPSWNADKLHRLAAKYRIPDKELEACKETTKVWSIRGVGK